MWIIFFFLGTVFATAFIVLGMTLVGRLSAGEESPKKIRRLLPWLGKGFGVPLFLWMLMNLGLSIKLQPFMPSVQATKNGSGDWFVVFLGVFGNGMFVIASYWLAVTLAWTLVNIARGLQGDARKNFRSLCLSSGLVMLLPALVLCYIGGWYMLGLGAAAILVPIAGYAPPVLNRNKKPMYSAAIARMKFGKYAEAEWEIIRQLEHAETDFDGWLMLAELNANQFRDLAAAEKIIAEVCDQPKTTPSQLSVALHRLADWQLQIGDDPDAARRALDAISVRLPGSHLARMAEARSRRLPHTREELREQRTASSIPLPALSEGLDGGSASGEMSLDAVQAGRLASQMIERLTRNPNDIASRERLARLMAESQGRVDAGIEQLELLLGIPNQDDAKRVEWLSLIAAWQLRFKQNEIAAREILQRIIREFPKSPQALGAQRRLDLLDMEKKRVAVPPPIPRPKIKIVPD